MNDEFLKRISSLSQRQLLLLAAQLEAKLSNAEAQRHEPIAVIGIGCRFPGANDPASFWRMLDAGTNCVRPIGNDRWNTEIFYDANPAAAGKMYTRNAALLDRANSFDAEFFGVPRPEAECMDPQQRLLLETAWEAVESAGYAPPSLLGSQTAVFIGIMNHDYEHLQNLRRDYSQISGYAGVGTALSVAAGRLSYFLGLKGPSIALDTACSSSLVAIHLACRSLRNGESDLALAGGVNLILSPTTMVAECKAMMLSPDGQCKTFDASADGYGRGEGCGVIVLKRLTDATRDGDHIMALIRGSAVNQDGRSQGLTAPNGPAQQAVIAAALADARVRPEDVDYVEAHGTGTPLGDPIEVQALGAVYGGQHRKGTPLWVGSVKTNIGHLESAAGIAGLIKVTLALQHRSIPPHLNLRTLNPHIDLDGKNIAIPTAATSWPEQNGKRRIGAVSSFGFSGTNAHVIIEEAPQREEARNDVERPWHALALSGKSEAAVEALASRFAQYLEDEQGELADVCYTANAGRTHFPHRLVAVARDRKALAAELRQAGSQALVRGVAGRTPPKIAFLFSGQGSQYAGMGRALYETAPVFRQAIDRCAELLAGALDVPLTAVLWGEAGEQLNETRYTQPALFALEYALAALWQSWGIKPALVMGHSVGEVVAACIAGVFSLEDGLKLIAARARLMDSTAPGAMVAALAPAAAVEGHLPADSGVVIAAENGPNNTVLAGPPAAVQGVVQALTEAGLETRALPVTRAFHSAAMEPILAPFAEHAREITYRPPRIPIISNQTGQLGGEEVCTPEYWARHILAPVKFADGMQALGAQNINMYLEVGPGTALLGMGRQCVAANGEQWLPSLRPPRDDWQQLLGSLARLYANGAPVDWAALDAGTRRDRLPLPTYPFQRQRYWFSETDDTSLVPASQPAPQELLPDEQPLLQPDDRQLVIELVNAPADQRWAILVNHIRQEIAGILRLASFEEIDPDADLFDVGLDSITALDLRSKVHARFGILSPPTVLFTHPTVSKLAEFFGAELFSTEQNAALSLEAAAVNGR